MLIKESSETLEISFSFIFQTFVATNIAIYRWIFVEKFEIELFGQYVRRCDLSPSRRKVFLCIENQMKKMGMI